MAPGMKKCPFCLEMMPADASFCGICKTDLKRPIPVAPKAEELTVGWVLMRLIRIVVLLFVVLVIIGLVIGFLGRGNFQKARDDARRKSCYANMRVLMGATEMYNMDNKDMLQTLDPEKFIKGKYLRTYPVCPNEGNRYRLKTLEKYNFEIRCEGGAGAHGTVD